MNSRTYCLQNGRPLQFHHSFAEPVDIMIDDKLNLSAGQKQLMIIGGL